MIVFILGEVESKVKVKLALLSLILPALSVCRAKMVFLPSTTVGVILQPVVPSLLYSTTASVSILVTVNELLLLILSLSRPISPLPLSTIKLKEEGVRIVLSTLNVALVGASVITFPTVSLALAIVTVPVLSPIGTFKS